MPSSVAQSTVTISAERPIARIAFRNCESPSMTLPGLFVQIWRKPSGPGKETPNRTLSTRGLRLGNAVLRRVVRRGAAFELLPGIDRKHRHRSIGRRLARGCVEQRATLG